MNECSNDTFLQEKVPEKVYKCRQEQLKSDQIKLQSFERFFTTARVLIFLVGLYLAWLILAKQSLNSIWFVAVISVFLGLVVGHSQINRRLNRIQRAIEYYQQGIDNIAGLWQGRGNAGVRYCDPDHPYSGDLDIFGKGSLFELICTSRTRIGEDMLAAWLLTGADVRIVAQRQKAIDELRDQIDFREELALIKTVSDKDLDQKMLRQWSQQQARPISLWQRIAASILGVLAGASLLAWFLGYGYLPIMVVIFLEIIFYSTIYKEIKQITVKANQAGFGLSILSQVLVLLQEATFNSHLLKRQKENLQTDEHTPSWQISRLNNQINWLNNCLHNQLLAPVAFMLGVPVHLAHRVEVWREQVGPHIPQWFESVGQIEAISSLSQYAFEHPDNSFPELVMPSDGPCFNAIELGHPLIPQKKQVLNDIRIDSQQRLIMISGSNMSGKSTLLRTVGITHVLALCGAPVRAKKLKTSRFVMGSAMRANDSLQQGASLFYSVISRISCVVELSGQSLPLLFLLDEILQGTNSHDRLVGAKGIIHQLLAQNAFGLVTTHDLALNAIVDSLGEKAINIHFEDKLLNGQMLFDYKIRPGVIKKSNALQLMRMMGLSVDSTVRAERI